MSRWRRKQPNPARFEHKGQPILCSECGRGSTWFEERKQHNGKKIVVRLTSPFLRLPDDRQAHDICIYRLRKAKEQTAESFDRENKQEPSFFDRIKRLFGRTTQEASWQTRQPHKTPR